MPVSILLSEIHAQPDALRRIIQVYLDGESPLAPLSLPPESLLILTGMGASFHAAWSAALHLNSLRIPAFAVEAVDLLNFGSALLQPANQLVYISQSGASAEVEPIVRSVGDRTPLIAVTNQADSPLGRAAQTVIPLHAGVETTIASKTYVNSLAILWLLARQWGGAPDGGERSTLIAVADALDALLASADSIAASWLDALQDAESLVFLGHGPHAATARHAAMTLSEVAKVSASSASIGAFRHGFIEAAQARMGVVVFTGSGAGAASADTLARELQGYGATVVMVRDGRHRRPGQTPDETAVDEFLSPILDVVPIQLFADALARSRGIAEGFRYIGKVIHRL